MTSEDTERRSEHLRARVLAELARHGVSLEDRRSWPYEKTQRQVGSSSIIVSYPPKRVLRDVASWRDVFSDDSVPPQRITVYCHVPFCTGRCRYCGFHSHAQDIISPHQYVSLLLREAEITSSLTDGRGVSRVASLYIGGGTPTYLEDTDLRRLIEGIRRVLRVEPDAEVTVEASPETINPAKARTLKQLGVTRVSVGAQTFDDSILRHMNRRHTSVDAVAAIDTLREAGHSNINIDLIKAYPGMSLETVVHDLREVHHVHPDSITTYELAIRDNSPLGNELYLPASLGSGFEFLQPSEQIVQTLAYDLALTEMGYEVGPTGWYTRHQGAKYAQQYHKWRDGMPLLAFGNSAYGYYNSTQYYNEDTAAEYVRLLQSHRLPLSLGWRLDEEEQARRRLVFGIKVGLELPSVEERLESQAGMWEDVEAKLEELVKRHLVTCDHGVYTLTSLGRVFSEHVAREFYSPIVRSAEERGTRLSRREH